MARKVFISFRYKDGNKYKEYLSKLFSDSDDVINCSESEDRSRMSEDTIKRYLYSKLKNTSVTIVLLTPEAINHKKVFNGYNYVYDDWIYDEIKYSLDDRENNRCTGLIAVYTPEAKNLVINSSSNNGVITIKSFNNLVRKNMFNIKKTYKHNSKEGLYNANLDHYCSLVSWEDFVKDFDFYIALAEQKRDNKDQYDISKRM